MSNEFEATVYERAAHARPQNHADNRTFMLFAMRRYVDLRRYIEDLKSVVIKNDSMYEFIASDDPCFFTNRFFIQKLRSQNFGLVSSGALFFLPLTPNHQLMCYDGKTYVVPDKIGYYVFTDKSTDVRALNELQYLKAAENVYFHDWNDRERIGNEYRQTEEHRPGAWHEIDVLVPDAMTKIGERYRRATEEERLTATRTMQVLSSIYPKPLHWISKLRHRNPPRTHYNGSAVGHVRKREWLRPSAGS